MSRPVLFVTNHAPPYRVGRVRGAARARGRRVRAVRRPLAPRDGAASRTLAFPHRHVTQREVHALAASGRYRAVVAGTAGRVALPAAWLGARRARVPFVLWARSGPR